MINKNIEKLFNSQIIRFLIVGVTTVLIDYIFYFFLYFIGFSTSISKGISFIIGAIFAYVANKYFTFNQAKFSNLGIFQFCVLYFISLTINVYLNEFLLHAMSNLIFKFELSFIIATITSASINFIGMKYIVFKD
tara:strand:+ start:2153 stop:2557 length:405 start_codon:yes stop_codon:yes gene_type:complete